MDGRLVFGTYDVNGSIIACDRTTVEVCGFFFFTHSRPLRRSAEYPYPMNTVGLRDVFAALPFQRALDGGLLSPHTAPSHATH